MKTIFSKRFQKEYRKQSGKIQQSITSVTKEVLKAKTLDEITDCKKIIGVDNIYRIRISYLRLLFLFRIVENEVYFITIIPRGEAYGKKIMQILRNI